MTAVPVYQASPIKRTRATKAEVEARREALLDIIEAGRPMTVRQVFYQATVRGLEAQSGHFIRLLTTFCSDRYFFASGLINRQLRKAAGFALVVPNSCRQSSYFGSGGEALGSGGCVVMLIVARIPFATIKSGYGPQPSKHLDEVQNNV